MGENNFVTESMVEWLLVIQNSFSVESWGLFLSTSVV